MVIADREFVEERSDEMLDKAKILNVAFLVVGDPLGATTHTDLLLRAMEANVSYEIIHNASIMNAVACCGLQLYRFGETVSLVLWTDTWRPDSYYDKIVANRRRGLHTLCLLDIKLKEPSLESLARGRKVYEPARFMDAPTACAQLLEIADNRAQANNAQETDLITEGQADLTSSTLCVALARVGWSTQKIVAGSLEQLSREDLGEPIHSLVVCGDLHEMERKFLQHFAVDRSLFS